MKKILKKLIKSFLVKKIYEYKNRHNPACDNYYDEYYGSKSNEPKYLRKEKKKKKKSYKYMLKKILD